uniref:FAD-binding oxidoreductase n=1 Tax=Gordonia sp. B7-2 TaxID=3420932 RepID=UPI003D922F3B
MSITIDQSPSSSLSDLRAAVAGPVFTPDDPEFGAELAGFNVAVTPGASIVVGATSAADVAAAVRHARANGLRIGVRATGHGPVLEGGNQLTISTSRMTDITVDPIARTARVGAGVRWRDVAAATAPHGLTGLAGSSSSVGVVGYTLGGGLSPFGREFGYAADHVRSIEVVTADGIVRTLDATAGSDLFTALLGARDGLGIVTAIEFDLLPVATFYGGGIFFAGNAASDVLHAWRQWAPTLPEEAGTSIAILRLPPDPNLPPPLQGQLAVHVRYTHTGHPGVAESLLAPIRSAGPVLLENVGVHPAAALDAVHMDPPGPMPSVEQGVALGELTASAVDALLDAAGPDVASPLAIVEIRLLGGKLVAPQRVPNAVSGRDAAFTVLAIGVPAGPLGDQVEAHLSGVVDAVAPWSRGALLNLSGRRAHNRDELWPQAQREHLAEIRRRHDPAGVFSLTDPNNLG